LIPAKVDLLELIAWDLDEYSYRNSAIKLGQEEFAKKLEQARQQLAQRKRYANCSALLAKETESIQHLFATHAQNTDLQKEYEGLDWTLGVIDLRCLLAFQRRLVFSPAHHCSPIPQQNNWPDLMSFAMGSRRPKEHRMICHYDTANGLDISLYSSNPDLQLRMNSTTGLDGSSPFSLHGGNPSFEVAQYRGRWFLRDGYHRAYRLLQAGISRLPAVVIYARAINEVGSTDPWFFSEDQLFSDDPPRVLDFLDERMVFRYERPALRKVIRIRIQESLEPFDETDEVQGEKI
jgi:hypothetical protein